MRLLRTRKPVGEANVRETPDRRRSRLVDRKFQFGLAWRLLLVMTALFVGGIVLVFAPSALVLATGGDLRSLEIASEEFLVLHRRIWPAAFLTFAGVFAYCLLFSHRIAGPIYRIDATLRQMLEGKPPGSVRFRKDDYFQPTAALLTELCRRLSEHPGGDSPAHEGPEGKGNTK